jgi:hypothetical protein
MTKITIQPRAGIGACISAWGRRRQRDLSDRVHAAGDERARRYGWEVTESNGRLGFDARTYRDPRFDVRRGRLSHGASQVTGGDHSDASLRVNRPACGPDTAANISPEMEAVLAERPATPGLRPGRARDQITGWNQANDHGPYREAGK